MKKLAIATLFASTLSFAASAATVSTENVKYTGDMEFASFCKAVVNNDIQLFKVSLNRFIGELGSSRKRVLDRVLEADTITCSGKNLVEFTQERNATQIDTFISSKA
ncbi:hypothetical protein [Aliiglaciecola sp. LCG003]|uniref:hypothetical protein n=1 Tax=Aliiglaciecola sp. LCG003 TaxID=3053655 RepID=UPI002574465D|nr:hypothetical protein [Aliiglaciecola sp. LCG003]WJG10071.1 hypothetical protein QR722_03255 [Aliiglaciecola sp. LCG003]